MMRLLNEVNMLTKSLIFTNNPRGDVSRAEETARRIQGLFLIRELAGKLYEGWQVLQKSYFGKELSRKYHDSLGQAGRDALNHIKGYFKRADCPIKEIRNKHAFHYDPQEILSELSKIDSADSASMIIAEHVGNCVYSFSEDVAPGSVLRSFDGDPQVAMQEMIEEVAVRVSTWFQLFGREVVTLILRSVEQQLTDIQLHNVPNADEPLLPFFARNPN